LFVLGFARSLWKSAQQKRFRALADSTKWNLETHVRAYLLFCVFLNFQAFPVVENVLVMFTEYLARNLRSPGAVKNYVFGLQTVAQLKDWSFPSLSSPCFKYLFKGIARDLAHAPKRASPLCPQALQKLVEFFNMSDPFEVSVWAVTVVGFFLFARLSNLLPKNKKYDPKQQFMRGDVRIAANALVFEMKWSKVIQLSDRVHTVPVKAIPGSPICPKAAVMRVCTMSKGTVDDHLFAYRSEKGLATITRVEYVKCIRKKLKLAGFDEKLYNGHSLRRGGASWAFSQGVPSELIKHHGDWSSDSYLVYLQFSLSDKLKTTSKM